MLKDQDFDMAQELPWNAPELTKDLELDTIFSAMALGDKFIYEVVRKAFFSSFHNEINTILYRQEILKDCLKNPSIIRDLYAITTETIEAKKENYWGWFISDNSSSILRSSIEMLQLFTVRLRKLRKIADDHAHRFKSNGLKSFFKMLQKELSDPYLASIDACMNKLQFHRGVLISAELGRGNKGTNYILRKPNPKSNWVSALVKKPSVYTFRIDPRDIGGGQALSDLKNRAINLVANSVAQSADHIDSFFNMLRIELAFYVGCLNLYDQLSQLGEPMCFPVTCAANVRQHSFSALYDICLALTIKHKVVDNEVNANNKELVFITGANQGGKTTFLRSIGLAQLMMQCGMFVPAEFFRANISTGIFTHFKREEDGTMKSGKLDEELARISQICECITPDSLLLLNESFAATNEREGSEIARQIISALSENRVKTFFVTHQYELMHDFLNRTDKVIFLQAERREDGTRTFKLIEGEPLQTSYGEDLYNQIFLVKDKVGFGKEAKTQEVPVM